MDVGPCVTRKQLPTMRSVDPSAGPASGEQRSADAASEGATGAAASSGADGSREEHAKSATNGTRSGGARRSMERTTPGLSFREGVIPSELSIVSSPEGVIPG